MTIKANQPRLLAAAQQALSGPAADFVEHTEDDRGHGRTEERILRTTPALRRLVTVGRPEPTEHGEVANVRRDQLGLQCGCRSGQCLLCGGQ